MNRLSLTRRAAIVGTLVEGNSIRATCRLTGASKNTVTKLVVDLGEVCSVYQSCELRNIAAKQVQCDEIWSFVGAKQRRVNAGAKGEGDVWTWTAMDADSKLMVCWLVGPRTPRAAQEFIGDLASRLANRVQLMTDGHKAYPPAVEGAFGWNGVDYAISSSSTGRLWNRTAPIARPCASQRSRSGAWRRLTPLKSQPRLWSDRT